MGLICSISCSQAASDIATAFLTDTQTPSPGWCIPCSSPGIPVQCFAILSDRKGIPYGILGLSLPALFTVSVKSTAQPSDSLWGAYISFPPDRSPRILSQLSWQTPCCLHSQSLLLPDFLNLYCSRNEEFWLYSSPSFLNIKLCRLPSPPRCLSKGCRSSPLTKHGEEPTGKPDDQGEAHAAGVFQYSFGGNKDATANHAADEQRESPQQSYLFPQEDGLFFLVFPHGFCLITAEGHAFRSYSLPSFLKVHLQDKELGIRGSSFLDKIFFQ